MSSIRLLAHRKKRRGGPTGRPIQDAPPILAPEGKRDARTGRIFSVFDLIDDEQKKKKKGRKKGGRGGK